MDELMAKGIKEEAVGGAIKLGSGEEHRVIDLANKVNELTGNEAGVVYAERRDGMLSTGFYPLLKRRSGCWVTNPKQSLRKV